MEKRDFLVETEDAAKQKDFFPLGKTKDLQVTFLCEKSFLFYEASGKVFFVCVIEFKA